MWRPLAVPNRGTQRHERAKQARGLVDVNERDAGDAGEENTNISGMQLTVKGRINQFEE